MLLEEATQPSSLVERRISATARLKHDLVVGRLELFLVGNDCFVGLLTDENLSSTGLLGLEEDDTKALGVGLTLLEVAEGRTNDILDATCSIQEKLHHGERPAAVLARDLKDSLQLGFGVGFVLSVSFLVALGFERPAVDAKPEAVTEIECEGCLELLLCRLTVLLVVGFLVVFLPQPIEVVVNVVLGEVLCLTHDFDEVHDMLLVGSLGLRSLASELRLPFGLLGRVQLCR